MFIPLTWFTALSFLGYGLSCLFTPHMRREFQRYRLARFRILIGLTQLAGAVGLIVGIQAPAIGLVASGGLAIQMLLGMGVRVVIGDRLVQALPAALYFLLNGYLFVTLLGR